MTMPLLTADVVCEDTSTLARSDWLALRHEGIGSSDAAAALGLSPWKSQYTLWAEKRGLLAEEPERDRFIVGREFEPIILRLWAERAEIPMTSIRRHVMARSVERPYMLANPDGLTDDAVIEVKTCSEFDAHRWDEGVPDQYVIQGLHLMAVTGRRRCVYPVMFGFNFPETFEVEWSEANAQAMSVIEGELWRRVIDNDPPDPDGSESTMMTFRELYYASEPDKTIELPKEADALLSEREIAVATAAAHTLNADRCKALLIEMLGDAEVGTLLGEKVMTGKPDKNGNRRYTFPERKH